MADVLQNRVAGDFLEAGVFRGGTSVYFASMLRAAGQLGNGARRVWMADAFGQGMPKRDYTDRLLQRKALTRSTVDEQNQDWSDTFKDPLLSSAVVARCVACFLNVTQLPCDQFSGDRRMVTFSDSAMQKQALYKLALEGSSSVIDSLQLAGVQILEGYFNETLPGPVRQLALLRVDADGFAPTYEVLERLYPLLSIGGYVVFDDWKIIQSQQAILQYRREQGITTPLFASLREWPKPMQTIDCMAFWKKER